VGLGCAHQLVLVVLAVLAIVWGRSSPEDPGYWVPRECRVWPILVCIKRYTKYVLDTIDDGTQIQPRLRLLHFGIRELDTSTLQLGSRYFPGNTGITPRRIEEPRSTVARV
jgi:hypothetical protein